MERSDLLADKRIPKLNLNAEVIPRTGGQPFSVFAIEDRSQLDITPS
jgi:hypothetical protein